LNIYSVFLKSEIGILKIVADDLNLLEVIFLDEQDGNPSPNEVTDLAVSQLSEYFQGKRKEFDLPLGPQGTEFQQKVWKELTKIPFGTSLSYLDMAHRLGDPKAIRAAASANGKNPISIIIPCHRVIGSDGSLTGYAGGLHRKEWLLRHENHPIYGSEQLEMF